DRTARDVAQRDRARSAAPLARRRSIGSALERATRPRRTVERARARGLRGAARGVFGRRPRAVVVRLALDTSAYSHFMRGDNAVIDLIDVAEWIGVPVVVLGELRTGFGLGKRAKQNQHELAEFLTSPVVHVLDIDD